MASSLTKEQIAERICDRLGVVTPSFSIGSTEPKELFTLICDCLGLEYDPKATKPQIAQFIVEAAGNQWLHSFESSGGTVTKSGILAVEEAVKFFNQ